MNNSLLLSSIKTKAMFIGRSRVAVAPPALNDKLTFDDHINVVCSKVHYSLRKLLSASEYISSELNKLRLVKALVIP
jgi:hypothetical protein